MCACARVCVCVSREGPSGYSGCAKMGVQGREEVWQGGKSQPQGALQIIPASLSSELLGGWGWGAGGGGRPPQINRSLHLLFSTGTIVRMESEEEEGNGKVSLACSCSLQWVVGCVLGMRGCRTGEFGVQNDMNGPKFHFTQWQLSVAA